MIFYRQLNPIQAMTFDLDDTLYENTSIIIAAEKSLTNFMHLKFPQTEKLDRQFWQGVQKEQLISHPELKNDMGQLRRICLETGFKRLGFTISAAEEAAHQCFEHFYFERSHFRLNENVYSLLKKLSNKLPLVAITNGNVDLEKIGISGYFLACFKANLKQPMKPHASMFNKAQDLLKRPAKNILHVGDNLQKDVFGALRAGYQTAWYAEDRVMDMNHEKVYSLPHIQLNKLEQLLALI